MIKIFRHILPLTLVMIFAFSVSACKPEKPITIGIVLPTKDEPRWMQDSSRFREALKDSPYGVDILFSQGSTARELENVETLVTKGIKVLIIAPQDGAAAAAAVKLAKKQGVTVIDYDRLIMNTECIDYYCTFDSILVGETQAHYLVDHAKKRGSNLYIYTGSAADENAFRYFRGAWSVLQPAIADGTFVIKNSSEAIKLKDKHELTREEESKIINQTTTNWDFNAAKNKAEADLTNSKRDDKGDVYILAPNDGTSRSIADVFAADKDVDSYVITGLDAEKASVQYIFDGKQTMTVFQDVRKLIGAAVDMSVDILNGRAPDTNTSINNGKIDVKVRKVPVVAVDRSNLVETIFNSGYYSEDEFVLEGLEQ